jgi:hypothetical protein
MRSRVRAAIALAMEMASMKPTSAMIMALVSSVTAIPRSSTGKAMEGRPAGIAPTTAPPRSAKPIR